MIKLLLLVALGAGFALGSPARFEVFDDLENEAEIIDAAEPLPGTRNLSEKRVPVIRLTIPAGYLGSSIYGNKNLAERSQLPAYYADRNALALPGVRNLEEKSIPEAVIARMTAERHGGVYASRRNPKSEVEKVVL